MKHVLKKTMAGSSLLLAFMFSLTAHAEQTQFYNVDIESFTAVRVGSSNVTRYVITWSNGQCKGYTGDPSMMSALKTAYVLKSKLEYLHCGCDNGDIMELKM